MTASQPADPVLRSGAALFTFDEAKRIHSWNRAAEEATGISSEEAVGRYCWDVLCSHDEEGGIVCHAGCSFHRLLCKQWPVAPPTLDVKTATGRRRFRVPMIAMGDSGLFAALLLDPGDAPSPPPPAEDGGQPTLTARQRLVLEMLLDGKQARQIASELQLSEMTVRNHIRAILRALGCSSQLSAVATARRMGIV